MEEVAVDVIAFLVRLILLVAIGAGALTIGSGIARGRAANASGRSIPMKGSLVERAGVGICAVISLLGLVVAIQTIRLDGVTLRGYRTLSVLLVVSLILSGLPAILWKTGLRWAAEGLACIALVIVAVIGMFSIGVFLLPLLVLMTWICIRHLREGDNLRRLHRGTAARAGI